MSYSVGIDLGTSFTSAAVSGARGTRMVPLSPSVVVPSVAYSARNGSVLTGGAAQGAGAADASRVARGFKRRIGDPTPLILGGTPYSPAALMAAQLRDVLATVSRTIGGQPGSIVLTCPASWGSYRREQFAEVSKLAGVTGYRVLTEPEAAATHYSAERRLGDGEVVAVYDLGGGTFDTTILRMQSGGMEILGVPEGIEHMGGIDFDETLLSHVDDRLDNAISELDPDDVSDTKALATIRALCVEAKEELSTEPDVRLAVPLPQGTREVTITRIEFNDMIRPLVQLTTDALRRAIDSASLRPDDLSAVLLSGGSSRIPLISQLVSTEFDRPVRASLHPKFTVALGAAAVAARPATAVAPKSASKEGLSAARTTAPPVQAALTPRSPGRWLVPVIAAAAAMVIGAVAAMVFSTQRSTNQEKESGGPLPLRMMQPWTGYIASTENWAGAEIGAEGLHQWPVDATRDNSGLRVVWHSGPAQVYLQNTTAPEDLSSYVDKGALVIDVAVHTPPAGPTKVGMHCVYPCSAELTVTDLLRQLKPGRKTMVKIPLNCFTAAGLDPKKVSTPFLVYTSQPFDATFSDVRWEPGAAADKDATPCAKLR